MASPRWPRLDERSPRKRSSGYRQHSATPGLRVRPTASVNAAWVDGSLAMMSEPSVGRFGRLFGRRSTVPTERDWERSVLLEPRPGSYDPDLVGDGGGLPFPPTALAAPAGQLEPNDPAVAALLALIARQKTTKGTSAVPSLDGWRVLARSDDEVLFGHELPPHLVTVALRRDARRQTWTSVAVSTARPLRATRDGVRASGWRLDPTREPNPQDTIVRVLVTEQTLASGKRADTRLLAPDLHVGVDELVLTMFVTPRQGFQVRSPNPETPARVALPNPIGRRRLIDGALYDGASTQRP
jgi:hypothetical protein